MTLSASLKDAAGKPLAGRTIAFQLGTQSASATTDANGVASTSLKLLQKNGTYQVSATFTPTAVDGSFFLGSAEHDLQAPGQVVGVTQKGGNSEGGDTESPPSVFAIASPGCLRSVRPAP